MTESAAGPECRFCDRPLTRSFVDLGMSPLSNAYLRPEQLHQAEPFYPLHAFVCEGCYLVQIPEMQSPEEIFTDYAYFSGYSDTWQRHVKTYTEAMIERFDIGPQHLVVEIASNDGCLLSCFHERGIPVLGIEPAANVAQTAEERGVSTLVKFFSLETARDLADTETRADLLVGNNVLAHVPSINNFVAGLETILAPAGVVTMEFPHLLTLIAGSQFDTIYHEHYSYLSLAVVRRIFAVHGLRVFDVEELETHGGSLRVFACREEDGARPIEPTVAALLGREEESGLGQLERYDRFAEQVRESKRDVLSFLIEAKRAGKSIAGYGAPAKGNTFLNYCGIGPDFLDFTVDRNPVKQGRYLPGSRLPISAPERIAEAKPDYLFILPWNLKSEIIEQMQHIRDWGGRFVVAIPRLEVIA